MEAFERPMGAFERPQVTKKSLRIDSNNNRQQPILLVLDSEFFLIPLERSNFLKSQSPIISRMTSLKECLIKSHHSYKIEDLHCFIPEADSSLSNTISRMKKWINKSKNKINKTNDILEPLKNSQPLLYCGHGAGTNFCKKQLKSLESSEADRALKHTQAGDLKDIDPSQILKPKASDLKGFPILMGCSSARLSDDTFIHLKSKRDQPYSASLKYLENGCSAFCGFLWEVTDRDTDIFTTDYIDQIFNLEENSISPIDQNLIQTATDNMRLKFINGNSFVMYGLPNVNFKSS